MSLTKKAKDNASSGLLFFATKIIITLIMNPLLIQFLGTSHFGIWKSIENFLGFASVADGKATQALKWTIANQEASNDFDRKKRLIGSALYIWIAFLPLMSILIGLFVYFSPELIKDVDAADHTLVASVFLLLGINLIITPLFGVPESVLIGTNQGKLAYYNNMGWSLVSALLMYGVVILGFGLRELAYVIVSITVLRGLNLLLLSIKRVTWLGLSQPTKAEVFSFFKFSSWVLSWSFISRFLLSSEILLISIFIGSESISKYIFTAYIAITGVSVAAIITSAVTPGLGMLIGKKDYLKSQKVVTKLREFSFSFSIFVGTMVIILNQSFVSLWAGQELFFGWEINILIVLLMIQLISIRNEAFLIDLSLDIKRKVLLGTLSVLLSLTLAILIYLYVNESISSLLLGILLGRFVLFIMFPYLTNKMIDNTSRQFLPFKQIFMAGIFISMAIWISQNQLLKNWVDLLLFGSLESIICMGFVYLFFLNNENRYLIKSKFLNIFYKLIN